MQKVTFVFKLSNDVSVRVSVYKKSSRDESIAEAKDTARRNGVVIPKWAEVLEVV